MARQDRADRAGDLGQILVAVMLGAYTGDLGLGDHRELGLGSCKGSLKGPACFVRAAALVQADQLGQHMLIRAAVECGAQQAQRGDRRGRAKLGEPSAWGGAPVTRCAGYRLALPLRGEHDAARRGPNHQARYAWASSAGLSREVEGSGSRGNSRESACKDTMSGRGKLRCIATPQ